MLWIQDLFSHLSACFHAVNVITNKYRKIYYCGQNKKGLHIETIVVETEIVLKIMLPKQQVGETEINNLTHNNILRLKQL